MIWTMAAVTGVFLGPFTVAYIWNAIQIHRLEKEERKLRKIEELEKKYGITISEDSLKMP